MLPVRTADTMSDTIALSSPSGRMSKRSRMAAQARLSVALFGEGGLQRSPPVQPSEREKLVREAKNLREIIARGMNARKFIKRAEWCEARLAELDA